MASNTTYLLPHLQGRGTHKAVSGRPVTDKAGVRSQVSPRKWHRDRLLSRAAMSEDDSH